MPLISIVVPVYHNAASLPDLLVKFQELATQNATDTFEFVFVDDGSKDNSFEVLQQLGQSEPRMRTIKLSRNFGSNPAILAGLSQIQGDTIAAIAADLQDRPELIHEMLKHWRTHMIHGCIGSVIWWNVLSTKLSIFGVSFLALINSPSVISVFYTLPASWSGYDKMSTEPRFRLHISQESPYV